MTGEVDYVALLGLIDALSRFEDADTTINAFIIGHLLDMKATEAAEMIGRAHAADRVDTEIRGPWHKVREDPCYS